PRTAADHTDVASQSAPRQAIRRCVVVGIVIAILYPLKYVARHVVEAKLIGLERSDRRGLPVIPLAAAPITVGVALADLLAPEIARGRAGARGVFPFGFCEQPVFLAGHTGEPSHIGLGVVPTHIDERPCSPSPPDVAGPALLRAAADRDTGVPIGECH